MYQRKYYEDASAVKIPENYSGLAIEREPSENDDVLPEDRGERDTHDSIAQTTDAATVAYDRGREKEHRRSSCKALRDGAGSLWDSLEALLGRFGLHTPRFDREDIILIGIALFLFFSKDGDKECALLLIALLFLS